MDILYGWLKVVLQERGRKEVCAWCRKDFCRQHEAKGLSIAFFQKTEEMRDLLKLNNEAKDAAIHLAFRFPDGSII